MEDKARSKLADWLAESRARPLDFGRFDCCTLCADYLMRFHGFDDPMSSFRGQYSSHREAMSAIKKAGGLKKIAESVLGEMQPMNECRWGAIVLGDYGDGPSLGICAGHNIQCVSARGLVAMPLSRGEGCWPV